MTRKQWSRRDLIKGFGPLAFLLLPVARSPADSAAIIRP